MTTTLVLTLIGPDRAGLVEAVAQTLAAHDASWLQSRMARLAGRFAGILHVRVAQPKAEALQQALHELQAQGLTIVVESAGETEPESSPSQRELRLELVGHDRPGIIRHISQALAKRAVNVDELETECLSAPMSGEMLFQARARLRVPPGANVDELRERLEAIAHDLMVDIMLVDAPDRADAASESLDKPSVGK